MDKVNISVICLIYLFYIIYAIYTINVIYVVYIIYIIEWNIRSLREDLLFQIFIDAECISIFASIKQWKKISRIYTFFEDFQIFMKIKNIWRHIFKTSSIHKPSHIYRERNLIYIIYTVYDIYATNVIYAIYVTNVIYATFVIFVIDGVYIIKLLTYIFNTYFNNIFSFICNQHIFGIFKKSLYDFL